MLSTLDKLLLGFIVGVCFCVACATASAGEPIVIDDPAATITAGGGDVQNITWETSNYGGTWKYYGYAGDPDGSAELRYRFSVTDGKEYKVFVTWAATSHNTTGGRAVVGTVTHDYISTTPPTADLTLGGRPFQQIATVTASGTTLDVFLRHRTGETFGADAVAIVEQEPPPPVPPGAVVRDDPAAIYVGTWSDRDDWATPFYGASAKFSAVASEEAPQSYEHVFTAPADGFYYIAWCYPLGGAEFDTSPTIRVIYRDFAGNDLNFTTGSVLSMQSYPFAVTYAANDREFYVRRFIGCLAGQSVRVRVSATIGKRLISDAVMLKLYANLAGEPVADEEQPAGEEDDGQDDPAPPGDDPPPTSGGSGPGGGDREYPPEPDPGEYPDGPWPEVWPGQGINWLHEVIVSGESVPPSHWYALDSTQEVRRFPAGKLRASVQSFYVHGSDHRTVNVYYYRQMPPEYFDPDGDGWRAGSMTLAVGRNGFVGYSVVDGGTVEYYFPPIEIFESLLMNPRGLMYGAGGPQPLVTATDGLGGIKFHSDTISKLRATLDGLWASYQNEHVDWKGRISRTADQQFDPGGGGSGGSGGWEPGPAPYRSFEPWSEPEQSLSESDLRQWDAPEHWSKVFGSFGMPSIGTSQLDVVMYEHSYFGPITFSTSSMWEHPTWGPVAVFLRDSMRTLLLFGLAGGCVLYVAFRLRSL